MLKKLQSLIREAEESSLLTASEQRALQDLKGCVSVCVQRWICYKYSLIQHRCLQMQAEQTDSSYAHNIIRDMRKGQDKLEV